MEDFVLTVSKNHYYRCYSNDGQPIFVYEDHRFIVPILWFAQSKNIITYPINLVYFDKHHDALLDPKGKEIVSEIAKAKTFNDVFRIVSDNLSPRDDTWLRVLMDLEIVKDAVVIGSLRNAGYQWEENKADLNEKGHLLENISSLECAFDYQEKLSDWSKCVSLEPLWAILGWEYNIYKKHFVINDNTPILLDFDLDYFTFNWRGRNYSWQDDFYGIEFDTQSSYETTEGWSGEKFLNKLIKRAPFVTIAKESGCCGGKQESASVLENLNNKLFSGAIKY